MIVEIGVSVAVKDGVSATDVVDAIRTMLEVAQAEAIYDVDSPDIDCTESDILCSELEIVQVREA